MEVGYSMPLASEADIQCGVINKAFNSKLATNLTFPIQISIPVAVPVDKGPVDFLRHAIDSAKMRRKERAFGIGKVDPQAIKQTASPKCNDIVRLAVWVLLDVVPEPFRACMPP